MAIIMLSEVFYWVFNMSITATVTGVVVLLIRSIRKIQRRITYFLWIIPFMRMSVPFGLNSRYSLMSLISRFTTKTVTVFMPTDGVEFSMTNSIMAAKSYFPIVYKINIFEDLFAVAAVIWLVVSLAIISTLLVLYFITIHDMKDSTHLRDNVYLSEKVQSPAVYGIIKPRIVIPFSYAEKDIEYILMHENMHIRRADNLWRIVAFFVTAVHWFNPLAWLFLKLFLEDIELACDEAVISKCDTEQIKQYAFSLLECNQKNAVFASAFGGAKIRTRFEAILFYKKMTHLSLVGFIALLTAIFYILLTNAA